MTPANTSRSISPDQSADGTIHSTADFSILEAIQQLIQERKTIEESARTAHASLSEMREQIRAEKLAADAQLAELADRQQSQEENQQLKDRLESLEAQVSQLRTERDQAAAKADDLEQQLQVLQADRNAGEIQVKRLDAERAQVQKEMERLRLECGLVEADAAQVRRHLEEERKRDTEVAALLHTLEARMGGQEQSLQAELQKAKAECVRLSEALQGSQRSEQSLRERLSKAGDMSKEREEMLQERSDLAEKLRIVDQIEAELRQQQAAMEKERERRPTPQVTVLSTSSKQTQPMPALPMDSAVMRFSCKHCAREVQVSVRRAGLMTKCPHCNKITSVPNS